MWNMFAFSPPNYFLREVFVGCNSFPYLMPVTQVYQQSHIPFYSSFITYQNSLLGKLSAGLSDGISSENILSYYTSFFLVCSFRYVFINVALENHLLFKEIASNTGMYHHSHFVHLILSKVSLFSGHIDMAQCERKATQITASISTEKSLPLYILFPLKKIF